MQQNMRDLIVVNLAIWIFFFVAFSPINASNQNSCGFIFLTVFSGVTIALGFCYLFGTAEFRKKIWDFRKSFKIRKK